MCDLHEDDIYQRTENTPVKDYLGYENARNKQHAALYTAIMALAFGSTADVLIGHHLTFELDKDLNTENEIPAADTLIFDHVVMGKVFGVHAPDIMASLALEPVETRDALLQKYFDTFATASKAVAA